MSFDPNDNMITIHRGNYEEFFILYMDDELSNEHMKMVDEFLAANPDLKTEFEIMLATKLPLEEFSFDKKDLLAENMKLTSVDEELLLYIDNELPADKKKTTELEIASNKDYQLQYQVLLQTKLDPSEKMEYPYKKELYRRTERVIAMKVWMRVAAAVVIVAVGVIVYFKNSTSTIAINGPQNTVDVKKNPVQQNETKKIEPENSVTNAADNLNIQQLAVENPSLKSREQQGKKRIELKQEETNEQPPLVKNETPQTEDVIPRNRTTDIMDGNKTIAMVEPKVSVNKADVTSPLLARNTIETTDEPNDRKGSVKGFLRKATRMIEKRTGIDPTNENGELLIGAVAINLK